MAVTAAAKQLAKPQLRGHVRSYLQRHLAIATVLSIASGIAWKYLVAEPRKQRYADFYANYDLDKEHKRMEKLGLFDGSYDNK